MTPRPTAPTLAMQAHEVAIAATNAEADAREDERTFAHHAACLRAAEQTLREIAEGKWRRYGPGEFDTEPYDTVSCEHVCQTDYVVVRLFMCHACIENVKADYIARAALGAKPNE